MALYSDLILKLSATLAEDGSSVLIDDATGTFDPGDPTLNPGGYAPIGQGTSTRPEESQVNKFLMYQALPFDPNNENIPSNATPPPHTFGLNDINGDPLPDNIYQFVFMVNSAVSGVSWATILANAYATLDAWGYITTFFSDDGSPDFVQIGQKAVWANVLGINCYNNARRELIDEWVAGGCKECDTTSFQIKNMFIQGITSNLLLAEQYPIGSLSGNDYYTEAKAELDFLALNCAEACPC
jgi:hypothetical protein